MGVDMEDKKLVECLISHYKEEKLYYSFFFFFWETKIGAFNGLICIDSNIGLNMCPKGGEGRSSSINCKSVKSSF